MRAGLSILQSGIWNLIGAEFSLAVTESETAVCKQGFCYVFCHFYICVLFVFFLYYLVEPLETQQPVKRKSFRVLMNSILDF